MALDKAIEHGKEHRRQYTGSKAIDVPESWVLRAVPWKQAVCRHEKGGKRGVQTEGV